METGSSSATSLGGDKVSTDAALRDRPASCCYHFAPSPGTGPRLTLGLWDQLATQHINEVWALWDGPLPLGTASKEVDLAPPSLPPWSRFFFLGASLQVVMDNPPEKSLLGIMSGPFLHISLSVLLGTCYWYIPPWRPTLCPSSCRSVSQDTRDLPDTLASISRFYQAGSWLPVPKQCWSQVSRSYPASAGSQWLMLQLQNEHLVSLFSQGLANQDFDRRFLEFYGFESPWPWNTIPKPPRHLNPFTAGI